MQIRPVSDLRNSFAEISRAVHAAKDPVILTKNGYGDMVVMSYDAYQDMMGEYDIAVQLNASEAEAAVTRERFTHAEVMEALKERLRHV